MPTFAAFLHRLLPRPVAERVCALAGGAMRVVAPRARTLNEATAAIIRGARAGADARLSTTSAGYVTGKAGVAMMTKALHLETNGQGIRAFGFAPGTVDTDMQVKIRASGINQISQIPRENLGGVQVPAQIIAYLCSDAAADLSGEELAISDNALRQRAGLSSL